MCPFVVEIVPRGLDTPAWQWHSLTWPDLTTREVISGPEVHRDTQHVAGAWGHPECDWRGGPVDRALLDTCQATKGAAQLANAVKL